MNKAKSDAGRRFQLGQYVFDPDRKSLADLSGAIVPLREQSLSVLEFLAQHNGKLVSKDAVIENVWSGLSVTDDSLVQCISEIRAAISDRERTIVRTIVGRGYQLNATVGTTGHIGTRPHVLVCRFEATEGSPDAAELAAAVTESIVMELLPRSGIVVMTDNARRSEAQYLIEGRASLYRERLRVYVQLQKAATSENVFAETWTSELDGVEKLPSIIAQKVANLLRIHMIAFCGEEHAQSDNSTLSLQDLLSKAAFHMSRYSLENWNAAREALDVAVDRAPDNPGALAMRASMATQMTPQVPFASIPDDHEHVLALADRAVALGPRIDFVLRTRGNLRLWLKHDHESARADCRRALAENASFHLAHLTLATSEILSGEPEAGLHRMTEMMSLATSETQYPLFMSLIALAHLLAGSEQDAIEAARESHERLPAESWNALVFAVAAASRPEITQTERFRKMVNGIALPFGHFRDMPFTDLAPVEMLENRMCLAGLSD